MTNLSTVNKPDMMTNWKQFRNISLTACKVGNVKRAEGRKQVLDILYPIIKF